MNQIDYAMLSNTVSVVRLSLSQESQRMQKLQAALATATYQPYLDLLQVSTLRKRGRQERKVVVMPTIK